MSISPHVVSGVQLMVRREPSLQPAKKPNECHGYLSYIIICTLAYKVTCIHVYQELDGVYVVKDFDEAYPKNILIADRSTSVVSKSEED